MLGGGSAVNAGYFCSEPHYWEDTDGWRVNVVYEEEGEWDRLWDTTHMVACTERVRAHPPFRFPLAARRRRCPSATRSSQSTCGADSGR